MKKNKQTVILTALAGFGLLSLPALTMAKPLMIVNSTKAPFSVSINNTCSGSDGFGVMPAKSSTVSPEGYLSKLCGQKSSNCEGKIFKSADCTGENIGYFTFDVKNGLKDGFSSVKNYSMTVSLTYNAVILAEAI